MRGSDGGRAGQSICQPDAGLAGWDRDVPVREQPHCTDERCGIRRLPGRQAALGAPVGVWGYPHGRTAL
jgi:hypothetical protein